MAKLKVGTGWGKLEFAAALQRAKPGDTLEFDPGTYGIGNTTIYNLTFVASSAPGQVLLDGKLNVSGPCTFKDLVIRSLPYNNAVMLKGKDPFATLSNCNVIGDPAGKYPAIWTASGTLVINGVTIKHEPETAAMTLVQGATLHATNCDLGTVELNDSTANIIDSTIDQVRGSNSSRAATFGRVEFRPKPNKRIFTGAGQSVLEFQHIVLPGRYVEGYSDDSLIHVGGLEQPAPGSFDIVTENGGKVRTECSQITVRGPQAAQRPDPEPVAAPALAGPKVVHWPVSQNREFVAKIQAQLVPGNTLLLLDEGEYFLEDLDQFIALNVDVTGQGRAERTIIHGTVGVLEGGSTTLSNVTIRTSDPARNAVNLTQAGGVIALQNVILESAEGATVPTLFANTGRVTMQDCSVRARGDAANVGCVEVVDGSSFDAEQTALGWVVVDSGATVSLQDCSSYQLAAASGASATLAGEHTILANELNRYEIRVESGASLVAAQLAAETDAYALVAGGTMQLESYRSTVSGHLTVHRSEGAELTLNSVAARIYDADDAGNYDFTESVNSSLTAQLIGDGAEASEIQPEQPLDSALEESEPEHGGGRAEELSSSDDPLAELNELIGLTKVKEQVQSFVNRVKFDRQRAELGLRNEGGFTLHSMFLGGPGTGKTTVAGLLREALYQSGVLRKNLLVEAGRDQLTSSNISGTAEKTRQVLESALGGILFIDEAYALAQEGNTHFAQEAVDTIIAFMEKHRDDLMVIVAGYPDKMFEFLNMNDGLRSRIPNRFDFEDYSGAEVATIGLESLRRDDYEVNSELYRRVVQSAYLRSGERSNGRWARNFNQEVLHHTVTRIMSLDAPSTADFKSIIDEDLFAVAGGDQAEHAAKVEQYLADLDALVGLDSVKQWVRSLKDQVTVNQRMMEHDGSVQRPNYHMAFTGNPGTGKTVVAEIVAGLFHSLGILSSPNVVTTKPTKLVGQYVGHTERNTDLAFDEAMGGVLFIDEAHQLLPESDQARDFGPKAIETMIPRLEDDRDKFVAILAGYTKPMERLFEEADPGLQSRIPTVIEFPDYTAAEVGQIVVLTLSKSWVLNEALLCEIATATYDALPPTERNNGRWARNFAERVVRLHNAHLVANNVFGEDMKHIPDEVLYAAAGAPRTS